MKGKMSNENEMNGKVRIRMEEREKKEKRVKGQENDGSKIMGMVGNEMKGRKGDKIVLRLKLQQ